MAKLPYERPRRGQLEAIEEVLRSFEKGIRRVALQAFTGFGKTAVAISVALTLLERGLVTKVVYCVRTRNELDPVIRELRRFGVDDFAVLFSAKRMCPLASESPIDPSSFWLACSTLRHLGKCPYYKRLRSELGSARDLIARSSSHVEIPRALANELSTCPFFTMLELARSSRFVVCTYPYVFKDRIWRSILRDYLAEHRSLLIVDEAHNLVSFGSLMGEQLTLDRIEKSLSELKKFGFESTELSKYLGEALRKCESTRYRGWKWLGDSIPRPSEELIQLAKDVATEIRMRMALEPEEAMRHSLALPSVTSFLEALSRDGYEPYYSFEEKCLAALPTSPKVVGEVLERFTYVLAMSGTLHHAPVRKVLSEGGTIDYLDVEELSVENPLATRIAWCVATFVTSRYVARGEEVFRRYASIVEACRAVANEGLDGATLFVYPSYEFMESILRRCRPRNECIVVEDRSTTLELVERVVRVCRDAEIHAVAGGKVTEGIEVAEGGRSLLRMVVVMGVPYPQPDDYLQRVSMEFSSRYGVDRFELLDSLASIRVLQSVGRCVRFKNDWGIAVLADSRFLRPSLRKAFRLGRLYVARNLDELVTFLKHALISIS